MFACGFRVLGVAGLQQINHLLTEKKEQVHKLTSGILLVTGLTTKELSDFGTAASCMFGLLSDFSLSSKLSAISSFSATTGGTGAGSSREGYVKSTAEEGTGGNHKRTPKTKLQK